MNRTLLSTLAIAASLAAPAAAQAAPTVYAAASLREAFPEIDSAPRFNFAGSNQLQTQIERGAPADLFASASSTEAQALFRANRCERPVTFATNTVVMLVPAANPAKLDSIYDLKRGPQRRLAVGTAGVPIGAYTRKLLARMRLTSILSKHIVSSEPNVTSITSKVALGSADAGFAYLTDARAAGNRVKVIRLPKWAQPPVRYQACVVKRSGVDTGGANAFLNKVRSSTGRRILAKWGFGLPPR
ncbi:molybdate ABC transporter substrate-binding protein [Solirubrobacter phytolaccae]|uniref:Molybdate ABC transporter substrate-binding protein n=1 Tax=Solirubrobacter phytolaccae TaxID=1404360 RepID=A0A9X3NEV2_9ACTN|nr:molybdate ABC transporter substrate-binding protein [Solirubrobacter phytolaccae]MDA0185318.1 molybdate ABC transporter substrate-binding protein [Solirubrobacter phytolaccae]